MAIKLADTLAPMGDFEVADAKDIAVKIKEEKMTLQKAIDDGAISGASSSDKVTYENEDHADWTNVKEALDGLIDKVYYVAPEIKSFTMTPSTTDYEVGETVTTLDFAWSYNKDVTSQTLTDVVLTDETDRTGQWTGTLTSNKTFTLACSDGINNASKSISIAFKNKIYYGSAAEAETMDSDFVLGLSNKKFATGYKGSYEVDVQPDEYAFIACPASWGIKDECYIGGFLTTLVKVDSFDFTNASGAVVSYDVLRTGRSGLGKITLEFK